MLQVHEAQERILGEVSALAVSERNLDDALGCVLAHDVVSDLNLPLFDNSAMDGYALRATDVAKASRKKPVKLRVVEHIGAGATPKQRLIAGAASRIFTGAPIPDD